MLKPDLCIGCQLLKEKFPDFSGCPMEKNPTATLDEAEALRHQTPHSQWITPRELARRYNYTPKHVLRLARAFEAAMIDVEGRTYILFCSFARVVPRNPRR